MTLDLVLTRETPVRVMSLPADGDDTSSLIEFLSRRYSIGPKYLAQPGPSPQQLLQAAQLALRAPDHRQLRPFRFVRVCNHQRGRLGACSPPMPPSVATVLPK